MDKRFILVSCIVFALLLLFVILVLAQGNNIVVNSEFDDGGTWQYNWWNAYMYSQWTGSYGHNSLGAGQVSASAYATGGPVYFWQSVTITPGLSYVGTFWLFDYTSFYTGAYGCANPPYAVWWAATRPGLALCPGSGPGSCVWDEALGWGSTTCDNTETWQEFPVSFSVPGTYTYSTALLWFLGWSSDDDNYCANHFWDEVYIYSSEAPPATPAPPPPFDCNLVNYSFDEGLEGWDYGDFVIEDEGWVGLHACDGAELNSYIAQSIYLTATGPSEWYELAIMSRNFYPVSAGEEPLLRWKLNDQMPGEVPEWYHGQTEITAVDSWQYSSYVLMQNNTSTLSDTLTIWTSNNDLQIGNVCILQQTGPAIPTPICPISPTYTPDPTYTPLPTPTAVNTATATAWAATATAWATQAPYPTQIPPNCDPDPLSSPDFSFIWLMAQLLMFLAAFFEAIFRLLGTILQPIFDFFGFILWLIGAFLSLIATLIDLIAAAVQFLFSFVVLFFNILEMLSSFINALWNLLTITPTDPGVEIPMYFYWGIAVYDFLIEGTPLEYLETIAFALGSIAIIIWTIRQFSSWS